MFSLSRQIQRNIFSFRWKTTIFWYITQVNLNSLFLLCFFNLLLCCPTTNIPTDFNIQRLDWQHSNSYIMHQPTELFCHTVLIFVKPIMLLSFNQLTCKYWGSMKSLHDFLVVQGDSALLKYRVTFFYKKVFLWQMVEQALLGKLMWGCCSAWWIDD